MFKAGDRIEARSPRPPFEWGPGTVMHVHGEHDMFPGGLTIETSDGDWMLGSDRVAKDVRYPTDWAAERADVLARFSEELAKATGDGSKKRKAGTKPPWYIDQSHEGAIFSHLTKWKRGEKVDPDSGAHPLVHLAWRALAIACQESGNIPS